MLMVAPGSKINLTTAGKVYIVQSQTRLLASPTGAHFLLFVHTIGRRHYDRLLIKIALFRFLLTYWTDHADTNVLEGHIVYFGLEQSCYSFVSRFKMFFGNRSLHLDAVMKNLTRGWFITCIAFWKQIPVNQLPSKVRTQMYSLCSCIMLRIVQLTRLFGWVMA